MRHFILILCILTVGKISVFASHIVGGEFELLHIQDFRYQLNMVMYFDEKNGSAGAKESVIIVYIYRKSDNALMGQYALNIVEDALVPYSNVDCDDGELITSKLFYTAEIILSDTEFDDPEGYYISYERCCRNYTINNIQSAEPDTGGLSAGQTFYLEFPPVVKNGEPFINSTPRLFPPLRDYGCVDKFYFADFGGVDDDGDSLVYSLVTPYSTIDTQNAYPDSPNSGPYPEVEWQEGFGIDNVMGGAPDLAISQAGLLTVTPKFTGLFVFAVKCEEYRNGEKIGEMRRDFQMLVVSNCINESPVVRARQKGQGNFYVQGNEIYFPYQTEERCLEILVNDIPVSGDTEENVSVQAIPINFNADLEGISIDISQNIPIRSVIDTARFEVCFPQCPYVRDRPYQIGIIALDDACPQPALDTVIVTLNVQPPPNSKAYFAESRNGTRYTTITRNVVEQAEGNINFDIRGFDDEDSVSFSITPLGFNLADVGMSFTEPVFGDSDVFTNFNWNFDCNADNLNFSGGRDVPVNNGIRKAFDILLSLDDKDLCQYADPRNIIMTLTIDFPNQTRPTVFEANQPNAEYLKLNYRYGDNIALNIRGRDLDNDRIELYGRGMNFNFDDVGASFEDKEGEGNPGLTSQFLWNIPCQFETEIDSFRVAFFVEDLDDCQLTNIDTLNIDFLVSPPVNSPPELFVNSRTAVQIIRDSVSVTVGTPIEINLRALDLEGDEVLLDLANRTEEDTFIFESASGIGSAQSTFLWTPQCTDLTEPGLTRTLRLNFVITDQNCFNPQGINYTLIIHVRDSGEGDEVLLPPNFFTPNGDGINEYFGMYREDETTKALINLLPLDNCAGKFEEVIILNRWGREVYRSDDRDFKWAGDDVAAGVYFYQIRYSNKQYRGSVTVNY